MVQHGLWNGHAAFVGRGLVQILQKSAQLAALVHGRIDGSSGRSIVGGSSIHAGVT